jgi:hypothetical protein
MKRAVGGTVVLVRPELQAQRLRVLAGVKTDSGELLEAYMPEREVSAVLPRSVLLGQEKEAPISLMATITPMIARMTVGRRVRLWRYRERWFFSFPPWKAVRFTDDGSPREEQPPRTTPA